MIIIYPKPGGGLAYTAPFVGCGLTVAEIAVKDTPVGVPFKIIERATVPLEDTAREAWENDPETMANPDGYGTYIAPQEE